MNLTKKVIIYAGVIAITTPIMMEIVVPIKMCSRLERELLSKQEYLERKEQGTLAGRKYVRKTVQMYLEEDPKGLVDRVRKRYWRRALQIYNWRNPPLEKNP